jgi:hypothetical protein
VRLSDVTPERIDWLWPGRVAIGKPHLIDGDPGLGKSTITLDFAARVSTGKPWPDGQPGGEPAGVVILSAEDDLADTIRPRLDAHDADSGRVLALTGVRTVGDNGGVSIDLPDIADLTAIREAIDAVDAKLVIIDPLMAFLPGAVNSHRDQDIRRALAPLARLAADEGVAMLIIRHLRKSGGSAVHAGGGSIGIIGGARAAYTVGLDPNDDGRCVFACAKINIAAKPPSLSYRIVGDHDHGCARIEWLGVSTVAADDLTRPLDGDADGSEVDAAGDWLEDYLTENGGEAARKDLAKAGRANGHSEAALKRAKVKRGIRHASRGFPRTTVWILPTVSSPGPNSKSEPTEPTGSDLRKRGDGAHSQLNPGIEPTGTTGALCDVCGDPLDPVLVANGDTTHPTCSGLW